MGADNIACRAIFEQFGPQKCMVGPHILQPGCFERQRKVSQSVRWGYATTPKIPRRTFLHNGFDDILCGIHPRELLQIEIWPILITVSLDLVPYPGIRIHVHTYVPLMYRKMLMNATVDP